MNSDNKLKDHSQITFDELRLKQSVRTTFKLSQEVIDLLGVLSGQLGIKQKTLLDQLTEDSIMLEKLSAFIDDIDKNDESSRPKSFVISKSALQSINEVAKKKKISRDRLVEISIRRLLPIVETELEKHRKRKVILEEMRECLHNNEALCQQAKELLGEDDDLCNMLKKQIHLAKRNIETADSIIERGMPMEEW